MSNEELAKIIIEADLYIASLVQAALMLLFDKDNAEKALVVANDATDMLMEMIEDNALDVYVATKTVKVGEME